MSPYSPRALTPKTRVISAVSRNGSSRWSVSHFTLSAEPSLQRDFSVATSHPAFARSPRTKQAGNTSSNRVDTIRTVKVAMTDAIPMGDTMMAATTMGMVVIDTETEKVSTTTAATRVHRAQLCQRQQILFDDPSQTPWMRSTVANRKPIGSALHYANCQALHAQSRYASSSVPVTGMVAQTLAANSSTSTSTITIGSAAMSQKLSFGIFSHFLRNLR
jgi:hypothetical protein